MLILNKDLDYYETKISSFIWEFKIEDNILYNLDLIFDLIEKHNNSSKKYCKPISILAVSVIEALMVDLVWRLNSSTNHFPDKRFVLMNKQKIKQSLKKQINKKSGKRLRNFGFLDLIDFFDDFKLLGNKKDNYDFLRSVSKFRNRLHIKNYYNNFEKDESKVFTEPRTQRILDSIVKIVDYFETNYSRPW